VPTIIRNLPLEEARTHIEVHGRPVFILPFQPIVWMSVVSKGPEPFDSRTPRIPAVVDLGFNGTFAIREEQLREWAGLDPRLFTRVRSTELRGAPADQRLANLWLHPNVSNTRSPSGQAPFRMELFKGIFVLRKPQRREQRDDRPRLPLLGFRALHRADLKLSVDCKNCRLSMRVPSRFWFFG